MLHTANDSTDSTISGSAVVVVERCLCSADVDRLEVVEVDVDVDVSDPNGTALSDRLGGILGPTDGVVDGPADGDPKGAVLAASLGDRDLMGDSDQDVKVFVLVDVTVDVEKVLVVVAAINSLLHQSSLM